MTAPPDLNDRLQRGESIDIDEQLLALAEQQAAKPVNDANGTAKTSGAEGEREQPTAADPLRGLEHLGKLAVVGCKTIQALAKMPVLYIWEDIAIVGIIVVIAGGVGCGKTTLLFWILAARASLGPPVKVLGRRVTPARAGMYIVLIEGEHGEKSAARKLVKSCRIAGVDESALDRIILVARKRVRIGSPAWGDVQRLVAAGLVSDIALDTLARVAPADANNEAEQVAIFDLVAATVDMAPSEETKPVVWVNAHTKKDATDDLDAVSGSAQRTGQADSVLMVKADRRDGRVISSKVTFPKLREEPDDYPMPVEYSVTRDNVVIVDAPSDDDARPLEERILERLTLGPQTKTKLAEALGRSRRDLEGPITNLFAARRIRSTTVQVQKRDCPAFELRPPKETPS